MSLVRWSHGGATCAAYREDGALCRRPAAYYDDERGVVLCEEHAHQAGVRTLASGPPAPPAPETWRDVEVLPSHARRFAEHLVADWLASYRSPAPDVPAAAREDLVRRIAAALVHARDHWRTS